MSSDAQAERVGNREKLLAGAMRCLEEKGYARTTARDLVAVSGANLASIGYHFGSKEALLNEAIARTMVVWTRSVEAEAFATEGASTEERMERALAAMVDRFAEYEGYLVSFVEAFPQAVRSDELRATMAGAYEDARRAGSEMLRRALAEDGRELSERDSDVLASLVLALCDGLVLQWLLDRERAPSSAEVIGALRAAR
jgi:AcrR family transcriptional regulator